MKKIFTFNKWKLKTKLVVSFILILLVPSIAIGVFSYEKAQNVLGDEILNSASNNVDTINKEINDTFETKFNDLDFLSGQIDSSSEENQISSQFSQYLELHKEASAIYVGTTTGETIIQPNVDLPDDFDPRTRGWYKKAMKNKGEAIVTDPYLDASSDKTMLTVAKTTNDGSGVIGIDISLSQIKSVANNVKIGENGYAVVIDSKNQYLVHPKEETGENATGEWAKTVASDEQGQFTYSLDGENKEMIFSTNDITGWKVLGTMYTSELKDASSGILISTTIVVAISLIAGSILIFFIIRTIMKPINSLSTSLNKISEGDLTETITVENDDELGKLAKDVKQMQENLKDVITKVLTASENLTSQSEELTQSATEVKTGSEQIASTMEEVASGAESQANNASELSSNASTFTAKVQEANANGEVIHQSSSEVLEMTGDGSKLMEQSVEQMKAIDQIVQDSVQKVQGLDAQSKEVSKLVTVIKDIAEQTNLLALNAAIEAARAGEQGKGFAVVADEVRKLAEQVANSVSEITGIVGNIQNETSSVVESLQEGYSEVEKGTTQIKNTGETFNKIDNAVNEMVESIQSVTTNLSTMAKTSEGMNASIDEIASVSEESAASVEETSAASQQASSSMEEVTSSSEELSKLAEELNGLVRKFKL